MGIRWALDADGAVLHVRVVGLVTPEEILEYQDRTADEAALRHLPEVLDFTECEGLSTADRSSVERVVEAASRARTRRQPGPLAILAPTDLAFGMARMYEALQEGVDPPRAIRVCRSLDAARRFLGLPASWVPPPR